MSKHEKKFLELVKSHPNKKVLYFFPNAYGYDDNQYSLGSMSKVGVDEYYEDDGIVWIKGEDECTMIDHFAELIFLEEYGYNHEASDEEIKLIDKKAREHIENLEWKECIYVFINP